MSEPTTPTGKRLVDLNTPSETGFWTDIVLAIEQEAVAAERYLNISGVEDEAEALSMLRRDLDDLDTELAADGLVITTQEQAAIGAAVERLPEMSGLQRHVGYWRVVIPTGDERGAVIETGDTIPEAISAALEEPTDE